MRRLTLEPLETREVPSATRDAWVWPFTSGSIWNTAVGSNATYVPGQLGTLGYLGGDANYIYQQNANDPNLQLLRPDNGAGTGTYLHIPPTLSVPSGPNNSAAFLDTDGQTLTQASPFSVSPGQNPRGFSYGSNENILTTDGDLGAHAGSGLSALGGTLRNGDLTSSTPITHALQIEIDWRLLYRNNSNPANADQTYVWPAVRSDQNFGGTADSNGNTSGGGTVPNYTGTVPGLSMGALLALPPSLTAAGLGLKTEAGIKVFHALQDYGAYVVDSSSSGNYNPNGGYYANITLSPDEMNNFNAVNGYSFATPGPSTTNPQGAADWANDMKALYTNLELVSDNGPTSIGGGGTPRQPAPPAFGVSLPAAPTNMTAAAVSPSQVSLSWTNNATNQTGFVIERATDRSFLNNLTSFTVGANVTTYTDSVSSGPTYYYRVHAYDASGNSVDTNNIASVTTSLTQLNQAQSQGVDSNSNVNSTLTVGNPSGTQQAFVVGFQLPTLGNVASPFTNATFTITTTGQNNAFAYNGGNSYSFDGLTRLGSNSSPVGADYSGASTTINGSFITTGTFGGQIDPHESLNLSQDITTFLNTQYAGGANAGKYVFLKVQSNFGNPEYSRVDFAQNGQINFTAALPASGPQQINLSGSYNRTGIVADGSTFSSTAGLDNFGNALSGKLLGTTQTFGGQSYTIGSAGSNNVVSAAGQTISVNQGDYATLSILAAHVNGSVASLAVTVNYTDGTTQTFTQGFSDWHHPQSYAGESNAISMAYRDVYNGTTQNNGPYYVYGYSFALNQAKTVKSITLPSDSNLQVLAMNLAMTTQQVSLTGSYNRNGIAADGTTFSGGIDGGGTAISANLIGSSQNFNGNAFTIGAAGGNNVVSAAGQTINVAQGNYSTLSLLATHVNGSAAGEIFTVNYSDGTSQTFTQGVSDWHHPQSYSGESTVVAMSYRNLSNGTEQSSSTPYNVYGYSFALNSAKTIKSITLPNDANLEVLAIDLS